MNDTYTDEIVLKITEKVKSAIIGVWDDQWVEHIKEKYKNAQSVKKLDRLVEKEVKTEWPKFKRRKYTLQQGTRKYG